MKDEKWGVDPVWCNFRLFDANSLAANQQLSLLYEKLPCLSRIRHAHALHSSSLFFSLSLLLRHSLPFVPLHSRATDFSSFSFSHHHASFSLFTDYTFRSLVHELHASIFLSLSDKQARSPFFFFLTLGSLDHLFIHERRKCAWTTLRSLNIAAVVRLRCDVITFSTSGVGLTISHIPNLIYLFYVFFFIIN